MRATNLEFGLPVGRLFGMVARSAHGKIGIKDVAKAAGVSRSAVSLVLNNGKIRISDAKRQAVRRAAERLGYQPSAVARRLVRRRMDTIGLAFPPDPSSLSQLFEFELAREIASSARQEGFDLLVDFQHSPERGLAFLEPGKVDGTVLVSDRKTPASMLKTLEASRHPHVVIGGGFLPRRPKFFVDFDVGSGTEEIARHLIELGHRRIAFFAGVPSPLKEEGFRRALQKAAAGASPAPWIVRCGTSSGGVQKALASLLRLKSPPTAIVATNDMLAFEIINVLRKRGVAVPHDLSVVGFDDVATAHLFYPALTTVRIPFQEVARSAVRNLIAQIRGVRSAGIRTILPTEVVVRDSAVPPSRSLPGA